MRACNGCKLKCEFTESRKSANRLRRCAIADTLAACARPAAQSHFRFSMVENRSRRSPRVHMCASISVSGIARRANRLRRCAIARQHARSLCSATGTVAPPFIDGRKSVPSRAHTKMHAKPEGAEILRSGKLPAPSRHRSQLLSHSVRRLAQAPPTPFIDGRKSVASLARTNLLTTTEGAEILRCGNSLPRRAIALGYSPRPCAGSRKHRRPRSSMVENRSCRAPTPT